MYTLYTWDDFINKIEDLINNFCTSLFGIQDQ